VPRDDGGAGLMMFTELRVSLSETDVEDDAARYTDTGHDQHQTLYKQPKKSSFIFDGKIETFDV